MRIVKGMNMPEESKPFARSYLKAVVLSACLAAWLLAVYLLSAGPAVYIMNRGVVSSQTFGVLDGLYRPAGLLAKSLKSYMNYFTWCAGKAVEARFAAKGVERPSAQQSEGITDALRWVEVGMSASEAQHVMEQHGFSCSAVTNGTFGSLRGIDYVNCDLHHGWEAALVLVEGRVSAVQVKSRLTP